ncbi:MAG TPA: carotenoid oxygenase family protein [Candidatus Baltobacteraceae bacterium]|nr:carotenoid oxygenase family protein [Candidatus Baltobacteraceae bacterium]
MVDFSNHPEMKGFFAATRFEADVYDCEVTGKIPSDLNGAFVRLGGDWLYPPKFEDDSPFSMDGYINMFRFKNGIVDYKGRWVKTPRFKADMAARRQLFGKYRNPFTDDPSVHNLDRSVQNTTPLCFAGKLFTLKEDSLPYEIDPKTLDTIGPYDFHGKYKSLTFTAHPKVDPVTGEMICYGYEATGLESRDVFLYTIDKTGHVTREIRFQVPYVAMVHDIGLTQKHVIIPIFGFVSSMERLKEGKVHWGWDNTKPSYVAIVPRDGEAKDIRWFKGPSRATVHTLNARTEGEKVILEAAIYDGNPFPFFPPIDGSPWDPTKARAYIRRNTFNLASKDDGFTEDKLFEMNVSDLGRVDDRYLSLPYRYAFTAYADKQRPFAEWKAGNMGGRVNNCYGRFDLSTGKMSSYFAGDTHSLQEVCFVPRKNGAEGEGYVMGVASNYAEMRSELVIADAKHLEDGDVARVILPFRATAQVHGRWMDEDELPLA